MRHCQNSSKYFNFVDSRANNASFVGFAGPAWFDSLNSVAACVICCDFHNFGGTAQSDYAILFGHGDNKANMYQQAETCEGYAQVTCINRQFLAD